MHNLTSPAIRRAIWFFIAASFILAACGVGVANSSWPGMSSEDGIVYVAYGPGIVAVDIAEEEELWRWPEESRANLFFFAPPSVVENRILVGDYGASGGMLSPGVTVRAYALRQADGKIEEEEWKSDESLLKDRIIASPLLVGDRVYIGTADNFIFALDASNKGSLLWKYETGHSIWGQPAYEDGVLYVSSMDKTIRAFDAESGELLWASETDGSITDRSVLNDELVYVSSFDGLVHAFDKSNGDRVWAAEAKAAVWGAPAFAGDRVVFVDSEGNVFAVDSKTGQELWTTALNEYVIAAPVLAGDLVVIAGAGDPALEPAERRGSLYALQLDDGLERWNEDVETPVYTTPEIVDDKVVIAVLSQDMLLSVHNIEDGNRTWSYLPETGS